MGFERCNSKRCIFLVVNIKILNIFLDCNKSSSLKQDLPTHLFITISFTVIFCFTFFLIVLKLSHTLSYSLQVFILFKNSYSLSYFLKVLYFLMTFSYFFKVCILSYAFFSCFLLHTFILTLSSQSFSYFYPNFLIPSHTSAISFTFKAPLTCIHIPSLIFTYWLLFFHAFYCILFNLILSFLHSLPHTFYLTLFYSFFPTFKIIILLHTFSYSLILFEQFLHLSFVLKLVSKHPYFYI